MHPSQTNKQLVISRQKGKVMIFRRPRGEGSPEESTDTTERDPRQRTEVGAVALRSTVKMPSGEKEKPKRLKPTGIDATGSDSLIGGW